MLSSFQIWSSDREKLLVKPCVQSLRIYDFFAIVNRNEALERGVEKKRNGQVSRGHIFVKAEILLTRITSKRLRLQWC